MANQHCDTSLKRSNKNIFWRWYGKYNFINSITQLDWHMADIYVAWTPLKRWLCNDNLDHKCLKSVVSLIMDEIMKPAAKLQSMSMDYLFSLQWRHNGRDSVSNHQTHDCLLNRLFRRRSKKTSKLHVTGLCAGNHRGPVNSPHRWTVAPKMFPFDDVIRCFYLYLSDSMWVCR